MVNLPVTRGRVLACLIGAALNFSEVSDGDYNTYLV